MYIDTKAIVLSTTKYSDSSLIIRCYTTKGLKSYLVKGILKQRKSGLRPAYFQPLSQLDMIVSHRKKNTLEYIKEVRIDYSYDTIYTQANKSMIVFFLSELLTKVMREDYPDTELFAYLSTSFQWLDTHHRVANFHLVFMIGLSRYFGFYPRQRKIDEGKYFNLSEGIFSPHRSIEYMEGEVLEVFKNFLKTDYEQMTNLKCDRPMRSKLLQYLLRYYELHLDHFSGLTSLEVLDNLF